MKSCNIAFIIAMSLANLAWAQVEVNSNEINVFANICEKISQGESKSSARLRATDKASFKAVEEIPDLKEFRQYLNPHQFNLKVYKLVDNHLEDMNITVTNQNAQEVCVEVSAYLNPSSISDVFSDGLIDNKAETKLDLENDNIEENINITVPPKPQISINEQIAYETDVGYDEDIITSSEVKSDIPAQKNDEKVSVFIDRTSFYNDTSTNGFFAHLEQEILKRSDVTIQAKFDNPNYILKTKVLKAKVDNINSETGRLHIVVSLELINTSNSEITTEHQNRFILFNHSEDAQTKAAELVKNLFSDGMAKIVPQMKKVTETTSSNNIITPPAR